ncbi:MAG: sensor histidine kinase [Campylobacterota bacterium]|nr:sensor histidine kinase [Campylobacterota bacterium]
MNLSETILRGSYFPVGSRDRLKAVLINLTLLLAILIMLMDVYGSIIHNYYAMSIIESTTAGMFLLTYLLFPQYISLQNSIYIVLTVLSFLFVISLTIIGNNHEFAFFWLATLPIFIFFFLGIKRGFLWTLLVVFSLILTTLNAIFKWMPPLHTVDLLTQITLGYMAISYLLYVLEKERFRYEINLVNALNDKEILLKEVHHRTKNNMQIMISLLDTQSFKIDNSKYKKMFQSHVERLQAMSLVHEHLYRGETYETVDIHTYLGEILHNLQGVTSHTILSEIDHVTLNMKTALNLGLVFNEAVMNAIEHAYEDGEKGTIEVSLQHLEDRALLRVKDYGKGFYTQKSYNTLGVTLMKDLSATLDDKGIEIDTSNGTEIKIYCAL